MAKFERLKMLGGNFLKNKGKSLGVGILKWKTFYSTTMIL